MNTPEQVGPDSWQRLPMPEQKAKLPYERTFSRDEFKRISLGLKPETMEGKWFIFLENGWLSFHRSWTGLCVYQLRLEKTANGHRVVEAWVNRDPEQYRITDDAYDVLFLDWVIDCIYLGNEDLSCPMPPHLR